MAAAAIEVIGVISGVLGIIQFGMDNFGSEDTDGSTVRVQVGLDYTDGLDSAGGSVPDIRLFNEVGGFIGMSADPGSVDSGSYTDMTVEQNSAQQATYTLFSANDDAVCIAYSSITWPDGSQYGMTGDIGQACGASWYYSNVYISSADYTPSCMWIDANGDQPTTGFSIHWPEFVTEDGSIPQDMDYYCNSGAPFSLYTDPDPSTITYWTPKKMAAKSKRSPIIPGQKRSYVGHPHGSHVRRNETEPYNPHTGRLVISSNSVHSTAALCESGTSVGPDLCNSAEGQFCRMADKTLWPVCGTETDNCFNMDLQQLIVGGVATRDTPYNTVIDWTDTGSVKRV